MYRIQFFMVSLLLAYGLTAQTISTDSLLKKIGERWSCLTEVRYSYIRELYYAGENYHNKDSSTVYIDFQHRGDNLFSRFQSENKNYFSCYNGSQYFGLDHQRKTIDLIQRPGPDFFENLSPLFHSVVSLRSILPALIENGNIKKSTGDTLIGSEHFYNIRFSLTGHYFSGLGRVTAFEKSYEGDSIRPYQLIVNRKTLLPLYFITRFPDRPADFMAVQYQSITDQPQLPAPSSWYHASYAGNYTAPQFARPLIETGISAPDWKLPLYKPGNIDSVFLHQFRGKVVMLDFWIKSCGPCLASFHHLNELQQKFDDRNFQLLSVNAQDDESDMIFFYKKFTPVFKMLYGAAGIAEQYGVQAYPTIILLDKQGKIFYTGEGFNQEKIEKLIKDHL